MVNIRSSRTKQSLKEEIRELAKSLGATDARVATTDMLTGPPSSDPSFVFPDHRRQQYLRPFSEIGDG